MIYCAMPHRLACTGFVRLVVSGCQPGSQLLWFDVRRNWVGTAKNDLWRVILPACEMLTALTVVFGMAIPA